jgi:hypothetical protein
MVNRISSPIEHSSEKPAIGATVWPALLEFSGTLGTVSGVFVVVVEVRKHSGGLPNGCDCPMCRHRTECASPIHRKGAKFAKFKKVARSSWWVRIHLFRITVKRSKC